jgi:hypothetical protein
MVIKYITRKLINSNPLEYCLWVKHTNPFLRVNGLYNVLVIQQDDYM